jgi:hypothetical protein
MSVNEILNNALELPINQRVQIVDLLTSSFNSIDKNIEQSWIDEANERLKSLNNNQSKILSYDEFFLED